MKDADFEERRRIARQGLDALGADHQEGKGGRDAFFKSVYEASEGDAAAVPWADLEPKPQLRNYLSTHPAASGQSAVDIGCGLGDNAEALAAAGYDVLAFDFAQKAIQWAKSRFPASSVSYQFGDLQNLPNDWVGAFDLVHECYTLQSLPPDTLSWSVPAVASLVAPGGMLLVYMRVREDGEAVDGPPWPLEESAHMRFMDYGLKLVSRDNFQLERPAFMDGDPTRKIPHVFCVWKRV